MEVGISYSNFTFTVQFELIYVVELMWLNLIIVDGFWLTAMVTAVFKWQVKCHDR